MDIATKTLSETKAQIAKFRLQCGYAGEIADPMSVRFIVEDDGKIENSAKVGWTDFFNRVHIKRFCLIPEDSFAYQVVAHELVHVNQYRSLRIGALRFGLLWARTLGRINAEREALRIGKEAEIWVRNRKALG